MSNDAIYKENYNKEIKNIIYWLSKASEVVMLDELNLEDVEKLLIRKVLNKHNGKITRAANELGLTRPSFYRRLEKYGI